MNKHCFVNVSCVNWGQSISKTFSEVTSDFAASFLRSLEDAVFLPGEKLFQVPLRLAL